jgi:hypothetical protein
VKRARWVDLAEAAASVPDGAMIAPGGFMLGRAPMALIFELVRQQRRGLHVISLPNPLPAEILVAAGAAKRVEFLFNAITLDNRVRLLPVLKRRMEAGTLDWTEHDGYRVVQRFRAAAMGLPFLPVPDADASALSRLDPGGRRVTVGARMNGWKREKWRGGWCSSRCTDRAPFDLLVSRLQQETAVNAGSLPLAASGGPAGTIAGERAGAGRVTRPVTDDVAGPGGFSARRPRSHHGDAQRDREGEQSSFHCCLLSRRGGCPYQGRVPARKETRPSRAPYSASFTAIRRSCRTQRAGCLSSGATIASGP